MTHAHDHHPLSATSIRSTDTTTAESHTSAQVVEGAGLLHLQQTLGNQQVQHLLQRTQAHEHGCGCGSCGSTSNKPHPVQRWYENQGPPALPPKEQHRVTQIRFNDLQKDAQMINNFVDKLDRKKMAWYDETRDELLKHKPMQLTVDPFTKQQMPMWQCESCGRATSYSGIDLGHIADWKQYLKKVGASTMEEAKIAYNDLRNLRIECATCNRSHDFETNEQGEFKDKDKKAEAINKRPMDLSEFIDDSNVNATEDQQAMNWIRNVYAHSDPSIQEPQLTPMNIPQSTQPSPQQSGSSSKKRITPTQVVPPQIIHGLLNQLGQKLSSMNAQEAQLYLKTIQDLINM